MEIVMQLLQVKHPLLDGKDRGEKLKQETLGFPVPPLEFLLGPNVSHPRGPRCTGTQAVQAASKDVGGGAGHLCEFWGNPLLPDVIQGVEI